MTKKDFVCSLHFEEEDYIPEDENVNYRGYLRKKRKLKATALPTLNLENKSNNVNKKQPGIRPLKRAAKDENLGYYGEELFDETNPQFDSNELMEEVPDDDEFNPWSVENLEHFLYYCCPECEEKCQVAENFVAHALTYHPKSVAFLQQFSSVKEEPIEQQEDYDDSNTLEKSPDDDENNYEHKHFLVQNEFIKIEKNIDEDTTTDNNTAANEKSEIAKFDEGQAIIEKHEDPLETSKNIIKNKLTGLSKYENGLRLYQRRKMKKVKKVKKTKKVVVTKNTTDEKNSENLSAHQPNFCKSCNIQHKNRYEHQTHYFMQHYRPGTWTNDKHGQNKEFSFTCDHCPFIGRLGYMYRHYQKDHPDDKYILTCTECDLKITVGESDTKSTDKARWHDLRKFINHVKSHKAIKDFMCPTCAKMFTRDQFLKRHMYLRHSDDSKKDFICELCAFKTHLPERLKLHYDNMHNESKKKQCPYCEYGHQYKFMLEIHIDKRHPETGEPVHNCPICQKGYIYPYTAKDCERRHKTRNVSGLLLFFTYVFYYYIQFKKLEIIILFFYSALQLDVKEKEIMSYVNSVKKVCTRRCTIDI